jgi:hypothetical protein
MYKITPHALLRIKQRTKINPLRVNELMASAIAIPFQLGSGRATKMFWSPEDDCAFLAYYNVKTNEIVTIYEAYNFVNGEFVGKSSTFRDETGHYHFEKTYRVLRSDVNYCLISAGLEPRDEFKKKHQFSKKNDRVIAFELIVTFEYHEKPMVRKVFKKFSVADWDACIPYDGLTQDVANFAQEKNISLDGLINVNVVMREPKRGSTPAGASVLEHEIDSLTIKKYLKELSEESSLFDEVDSEYSFLLENGKRTDSSSVESMQDYKAIKLFQAQKAKQFGW